MFTTKYVFTMKDFQNFLCIKKKYNIKVIKNIKVFFVIAYFKLRYKF